eukprot:127325_1
MATHQNACVRKQKLQNDMKQKKRRSSSFFTSYFKPKVSADDKSSASSSQQLRQQPSSTGDKSYAPLPSSPHKAVASSPSPPSAAHKADAPVTAPNTKPSNSRQNSLMSTATASVKRRIALVNDSNEIIEWIEAPNIYLPKCRGCIPTAITDETKCNAEDITCFLELIPIPKITKHTTWWVSQTGIHHSSCVGVITKSTTAEQCNDRCHNLRDNPALRELIEISFKTGEGARNCVSLFEEVKQSTHIDSDKPAQSLCGESDFVVVKSGHVFYLGYAIGIYRERQGERLYYDDIYPSQMDKSSFFINFIPIKLIRCDRKGNCYKIKELQMDKRDYKRIKNQTKMGNGRYVIQSVPTTQIVRIEHDVVNKDIFFRISRLKICILALKPVDAAKVSAQESVKLYELSALLKSSKPSNDTKLKSSAADKKATKLKSSAADKKATKPHAKSFVKNDKHSCPCAVCHLFVKAKNLMQHHSMHMIEKSQGQNGEVFQAKLRLQTTHKYTVDADTKSLQFVAKSSEDSSQLPHDVCFHCLSSNCQRSIGVGAKKGGALIPITIGCPLSYKYSYNIARNMSVQSPCTNVPMKCDVKGCAMWIYKYMMSLHYETLHKQHVLPLKYCVSSEEASAVYKCLAKETKQKTKTGRAWQCLVEPIEQTSPKQKSRQKASDKYSIKINDNDD